MRKTAGLLLSSLLLMTLAGLAHADPSMGLAIGTKAPAFELVDQSGKTRSLESLLGRGTLAILFYRSADW